MNYNQIAAQYRQTSTQGRHPVGMVVKLYDAILEDFRRALSAVRSGNVEQRVSALNHSLLIIAELEGVLDHERGGEVAKHLKGFYRVTRAMILEENVRARSEGLEKLISLYMPVRQAWQQAEQELASESRAETKAPSATYTAASADNDGFRASWNG
ncbi:MAG TPA: flagellar export chaperone FliS [Candidatus Acidoferrales bacterium]|jgi:flagellar protein FliS|nr:flagellar export chaperone FliS [Candidatus Acidoferrales bacterium]